VAVLIAQLVRSGWNRQLARQAKPANTQPLPPLEREGPQQVVPDHAAWEQAVVAIQSRERTGQQSHGSGFVVGDTGLVATNLHVSASCTEAIVRFADGTTYEVAGYAAVDPAHDLALLKLKDAARSLPGFKLGDDADPPRRLAVWAIGHPQGLEFSLSPGEVSRVLPTSDLPAASQKFLRALMNGAAPGAETRWIQHSAAISPGSSGGPLVDAGGRVLGINTWIDQEARFHYALPVVHLRSLLSQAESGAVEPLAAHATAEARMNQQLWQLSAARLQDLLEQGRGMKWQPQSSEDYRMLQQLAWAITIARRPDTLAARGSLGDKLDELARAADAAAEQLRLEKWNQAGQVTILNEYAAEALRRPMAGQFLFATIERVVTGDDQRRGLIATLAGFDEPLFLPLEDQLVPPEAGAQVLVLGVNYQGRVAQWGDNPLKLISAPIIVPGVMIQLE
jgi:S1-C subfamily serine protease